MKRIISLLLIVFLLTGCGLGNILPDRNSGESETAGEPADETESTVPDEEPLPWTETVGMPWDKDGVLLEMPLTIPDGLHYSYSLEMDGDLLLWSMDTHLQDCSYLELCLIELDDGSVRARRDVAVSEYVTPQVYDGYIYVCDRSKGYIEKLDKALRTVDGWSTQAVSGTWYMGAEETLYIMNLDDQFLKRDLNTGATEPVLDGDPAVSWISLFGETVMIEYYRGDTGAGASAVLDLRTGEVLHSPFGEEFDSVAYKCGAWLCENYSDNHMYYYSTDGSDLLCLAGGDSYFALLDEGYLLETTYENDELRLYDLQGELISGACVMEYPCGYTGSDLIWNESLGGFFFEFRGYDETRRLLFWDISKSTAGEDLTFTPVPKPDEVQQQLEAQAEVLEQKYGVTILVGEECDTVFDEFSATRTSDWEEVTAALDTLDQALSVYPDGFIRQLRYGSIRGIQIQLVSELWADGSGRYGDGYIAFTQPQWDYYLMVIDIDDVGVDTYYHEFSHIIDSYLEWDAMQREDALYSEERWAAFNPGWFPGYSYDYSVEHYVEDYAYFIDGYSTVSPTEDRARIMEYAMSEYGYWTFEGSRGLLNKLEYYSKCIRDAFDTTGWPETVLWEQYLS